MTNERKKDFLTFIKSKYDFHPIPYEGGLFHQTYISEDSTLETKLRGRLDEERVLDSTGYFLLEDEDDCFSAIHKLKADETYHFYRGDPIELLLLYPDGSSETIILGPDMQSGHEVQHTVLAGIWQGSRLLPGGEYAFMSVSMSPGYHDADFELGVREELQRGYPERADLIELLTRK